MSDVPLLRSDTAYMVPNHRTSNDVPRTNIVSNGAMSSVGAVQGIMIIEDAIEKAAVPLGLCADEIRSASL